MIFKETVIPCMFRITYLWLDDGREVWAKPIGVNDHFMSCWTWNGLTWEYSSIHLQLLECFICVGY